MAVAAAQTAVPGRFEVVDEAPVTVFDGAHNPDGMDSLVAALREFLDGRPLVAVISVLDDKDAAAMLGALGPLCSEIIVTKAANPRTLPPATLVSLARQLDGPADTHRARAARCAGRGARGGRPRRRRARHRLDLPDRRSAASARGCGVDAVNDDGPSVLAMVLWVALMVALVILVFFGIGYLVGRLFL